MLELITNLLTTTPGLKAKNIAKNLNQDKQTVNSFLYSNKDTFQVDDNFCWFIKDVKVIRIEFSGQSWIDCCSFEQTLSNVCSPLDSEASNIIFKFPKDCKILLEAAARIMALSNQLIYFGKTVSLDFSECNDALSYLNRIDFFEHLDKDVAVLPKRPDIFNAKGSNDILVELCTIDPVNPDLSIPKQLKQSFVSHAGNKYSQAAFTVLSELFGNVSDHSESPIPGFVALQCYKNSITPHIQTVISDSGKGIIGTLKPILDAKYPKLVSEITKSKIDYNAFLLKAVFMRGKISQSNEEGRGLGLKRSSDAASKFNATILIRQENCEAKILYRNGELSDFQFQNNMTKLLGTHICFDFLLD